MKKQKRPAARASSKKVRAKAKARRVVARPAARKRTVRAAASVRATRRVRASRRATPVRVTRASIKARSAAPIKVPSPAAAPAQKAVHKLQSGAMQKAISRMAARTAPALRPRPTRRLEASRPARPAAPVHNVNRQLLRLAGAQQFNYMKAPGSDTGFEVGDTVEVFCDHERDGERIRGWIKGVVVQVDNKLVAVQFRTNVFLTDGWMGPDRILWYSLTSDQIRSANFSKKGAHRPIPEY